MASTIKVDTITTPDGTGNISVDRPLSGSGAGLTSLPAANLTGALPAISGASLTGLSAGAWSVKSSGTLSSASEFIVTSLSKTTKIFLDLTFGSDANFTTMQTSVDNGSSFSSATGDYGYTTIEGRSSNASHWTHTGNDNSTVSFSPGPYNGSGNASGESTSMEWTIYNPSASTFTLLQCNHIAMENDGYIYHSNSAGYRKSAAAVNAVRIYPRNGSNFSGAYVVVELN